MKEQAFRMSRRFGIPFHEFNRNNFLIHHHACSNNNQQLSKKILPFYTKTQSEPSEKLENYITADTRRRLRRPS